MNKTISSVIDDINKWNGPNGTIYYVTAFFTDGDVGSAGRKDIDAALELQGLLQEAIGQELDFVLEPKKPTKSGKAAWKILGFGTPGGAATYTAPGVQGGGPGSGQSAQSARAGGRSPEPSSEQASIRASVALKAAVDACHGLDINAILEYADAFNAWMLEKISEPALSEYGGGPPGPPSTAPAGAGSEQSSPASVGAGPVAAQATDPSAAAHAGDTSSGELSSLSTPDSAEGGSTVGEASAPSEHIHDYQLRQGVRGFLVCEGCGATRKKETV